MCPDTQASFSCLYDLAAMAAVAAVAAAVVLVEVAGRVVALAVSLN
jgi:hypothetical protein